MFVVGLRIECQTNVLKQSKMLRQVFFMKSLTGGCILAISLCSYPCRKCMKSGVVPLSVCFSWWALLKPAEACNMTWPGACVWRFLTPLQAFLAPLPHSCPSHVSLWWTAWLAAKSEGLGVSSSNKATGEKIAGPVMAYNSLCLRIMRSDRLILYQLHSAMCSACLP